MMDDEIIILTGSDDTMSTPTLTYDSSHYPTVNVDTVSIDTSSWNNFSITSPSYDPAVKLDSNGINMDAGCDVKIGDRSLKDFMDRVEERLNNLRPNPKLEDKWDELAELGKRYRELEAEILEKEKMWNILKDGR